MSRNGYDPILLIFVTMTLLAGFSPNSTPPFKQIRNAGNSKNQERGGTPRIFGGGAFTGAGRGQGGGGAFTCTGARSGAGLTRTPHWASLPMAIDSSSSVALEVGQQLRQPRNHDIASPILASRRKHSGGCVCGEEGGASPNATSEPKMLWQLPSDARYATVGAQVLHKRRSPGGTACSNTRRTWRKWRH